MSVTTLIDNWASARIAVGMFTDVDDFLAARGTKSIVFVAWLYSGKSQMAFRKLCDVLEQCPGSAPPVLVLDADAASEQTVFPQARLEGESSGMLVMYRDGDVAAVASGARLDEFTAVLTAFLSA